MKKFLLKILSFSLPILIIGITMEFLLRQIPNQYVLKNSYLTNNSKTIESIILGSSHSYYGVNPEHFSKPCFNASNISQSLDFDFVLLKKYENSLSNLKTVILPISYFSLFETLNNGDESWRIKNYSIYYDLDVSNKIVENSEVMSINLSDNIKRTYTNYIKSDFNLDCSNLGWGNSYLPEDALDLDKTGISSANRHSIKDFNLLEQNLMTLKSIIKLCQKQNVNVLLFTPPAYKSYYQNLNSNQLYITINSTKELANSFNNCTYINLLEDSSFNKNDYFDADHLNTVGAKKLSILLNQLISN